jgi:hypothetical protein
VDWGDVPASTFTDGRCDACRSTSDPDLIKQAVAARDEWFDAYWKLAALTGRSVLP